MSKRESIARYMLIIRQLRNCPASFEKILTYLNIQSELEGYDYTISKRTFQRDLNDIRSLFDIDIQYDASQKVYYINYDEQPQSKERIVEAFETFNALNFNRNITKFVFFENRRPLGTNNLYGLFHAIKNHFQIVFTYTKYWDDISTQRAVNPYALKEYRNRWYLLAMDLNDNKLKTFGLDRITNLEITTASFKVSKNFDVKDYFRYSFGVINPENEDAEEIILSFSPFQGKYIKSMPLHSTQEIIKDDSKELRIKLKMYITYDFVMEIMSMGEEVKIIQPQRLIDEVRSHIEKTLKQY